MALISHLELSTTKYPTLQVGAQPLTYVTLGEQSKRYHGGSRYMGSVIEGKELIHILLMFLFVPHLLFITLTKANNVTIIQIEST